MPETKAAFRVLSKRPKLAILLLSAGPLLAGVAAADPVPKVQAENCCWNHYDCPSGYCMYYVTCYSGYYSSCAQD